MQTVKVVGRQYKSNSGSSLYWLILEDSTQIPCTKLEFEAGQLARFTGGVQVVSKKRCTGEER